MLAASSVAHGAAVAAEWTERERDTIARLRRELAALRRERAALRAVFLPPGVLPAVLNLTPQEAVIVSVLLTNDQVTHELMWQALYHDCDLDAAPQDKTVDVQICKARKRLAPFGIRIETFNRLGWRMAPVAKAKVLNLMRNEAEATGRPMSDFVAVDMAMHPFQVRPAGRGRELQP